MCLYSYVSGKLLPSHRVFTAKPVLDCAISEGNLLKSELEQALAAGQRGLTKQEKESVCPCHQ